MGVEFYSMHSLDFVWALQNSGRQFLDKLQIPILFEAFIRVSREYFTPLKIPH